MFPFHRRYSVEIFYKSENLFHYDRLHTLTGETIDGVVLYNKYPSNQNVIFETPIVLNFVHTKRP